MTVETQDANGQPVTQSGPYAGNGVTTTFDFDFPVDRAEAVRVLVADGTGVETVLALTTDYTVDLGDSAGGSITLTSASLAPPGSELVIQYNGDFNQSAAISNQGNLNLSVLEGSLDKMTMHLRQLKNEVDRAVRISAFADAGALEQLRGNLNTAASIADEIVIAAANIGAITAAPGAATAAANSATAAAASETAAANSATAAAASQTAAAGSATAAANSATAAANSATAAANSATAATNSATLAQAWAQNPEDVEVAPGEFSARHWAAKAQEAATIPDFATQAQAEAGTNNDTIMTPLRTAQSVTARLADQATAEAGTDNVTLMTPLRTAQAIAAQASGWGTSALQGFNGATALDFTGIPTDVTEIMVQAHNVKKNNTNHYLVQLITGSGAVEDGYYGLTQAEGQSALGSINNGWRIYSGTNTHATNYIFRIFRFSATTWQQFHIGRIGNINVFISGYGYVIDVSEPVTGIRFTRESSGTGTSGLVVVRWRK